MQKTQIITHIAFIAIFLKFVVRLCIFVNPLVSELILQICYVFKTSLVLEVLRIFTCEHLGTSYGLYGLNKQRSAKPTPQSRLKIFKQVAMKNKNFVQMLPSSGKYLKHCNCRHLSGIEAETFLLKSLKR